MQSKLSQVVDSDRNPMGPPPPYSHALQTEAQLNYAINNNINNQRMVWISPMPPEITRGFTSDAIINNFLRKTLALIFVELLLTCCAIALFVYEFNINNWIQENPMFIFGLFIALVILILISYFGSETYLESPYNYFIFGSLVIVYATLVGSVAVFTGIVSMFGPGFAAAISLALILFTFQNKFKWSIGSSSVLTLIVLGITAGIAGLMVHFGVISEDSDGVQGVIFSIFSGLVFSGVMIYNLDRMVTGRHRFNITPDGYIIGGIGINVDIVLIILILLALASGRLFICWRFTRTESRPGVIYVQQNQPASNA